MMGPTRVQKRAWRRRLYRERYTLNRLRMLTFFWRPDGTPADAIYDHGRTIVPPWERPAKERG